AVRSKTSAVGVDAETSVIYREATDEADPGFLERLGHWLRSAVPGLLEPYERAPRLLDEARRLLENGEPRAALIAAVSALERALAPGKEKESAGRRASPSLRDAIDQRFDLSATVRARLVEIVRLRNAALHNGAAVTPSEARAAISAVASIVKRDG